MINKAKAKAEIEVLPIPNYSIKNSYYFLFYGFLSLFLLVEEEIPYFNLFTLVVRISTGSLNLIRLEMFEKDKVIR